MKSILPLLHTVPIVVVGVKRPDRAEDIANYCTIGDVAIAGIRPPLVMISLHERHLTCSGIDAFGRFSINVPDRTMLPAVDYCGMVSGRDKDKSTAFPTTWSPSGVPYAESAPIVLICSVERRVQIETRVVFIARVEDVIAAADLELDRLHGIQYGLDNRYYGTGEPIGEGYHEGKTLLDK
jgi:flavin reductase (DIM6/NTAB) family NADH-FMN oxidoreductase RutF